MSDEQARIAAGHRFASRCPTLNSESVETRSLPTLTHCFPRNFTFYVAHPIRSIREQAFNVQRLLKETKEAKIDN
jgi:hypothetical protein